MKQFLSKKCQDLAQGLLIVVLQAIPAMKDGLVADWDVVESLWDHALRYF